MIGQLRGQVWSSHPPTLVLGVAGVGYEIDLPLSAFAQFGPDSELTLHTHYSVRDDGVSLFGFLSRDERELFRRLLKVNGVGPRLALVLLSSLPPAELAQCIELEDLPRLTKVPGIGRKTAERLMLELRGKLDGFSSGAASVPRKASDQSEAEAALLALGYSAREAQKMIQAVPDYKTLAVADLIRLALRQA